MSHVSSYNYTYIVCSVAGFLTCDSYFTFNVDILQLIQQLQIKYPTAMFEGIQQTLVVRERAGAYPTAMFEGIQQTLVVKERARAYPPAMFAMFGGITMRVTNTCSNFRKEALVVIILFQKGKGAYLVRAVYSAVLQCSSCQ